MIIPKLNINNQINNNIKYNIILIQYHSKMSIRIHFYQVIQTEKQLEVKTQIKIEF